MSEQILLNAQARTDSTASDIYATYVDAHVEFDTDGSRTEWSM